jgi:hypothetical protein
MVKLGDWLSEGFNLLKDQFWAWVVVMLVFFLLSLLIYTCVGYFLIIGVIWFGPHAVALKQIRGGRVEVGDMFSTFGLILPALGFTLILLLISIPSMILFMLPLLFIMPLWIFVPHLVVDKQMGLIEAMKASQQVVLKDYWWFVITSFVVGFVSSLGSYLCYVGILASMPLYFTTLAVAYRDCFGIEGAYSFKTEDLQRRDSGESGGYYQQ